MLQELLTKRKMAFDKLIKIEDFTANTCEELGSLLDRRVSGPVVDLKTIKDSFENDKVKYVFNFDIYEEEKIIVANFCRAFSDDEENVYFSLEAFIYWLSEYNDPVGIGIYNMFKDKDFDFYKGDRSDIEDAICEFLNKLPDWFK